MVKWIENIAYVHLQMKAAFDIKEEQANAMVSFIQEHLTINQQALVTVGSRDIVILPGQMGSVLFQMTNPVVEIHNSPS